MPTSYTATAQKKYLDADGLTHLAQKLNNYPTNDVIGAVVDGVQDALDEKLDVTLAGSANGVATLGSDGKVPSTQLPESMGTTYTLSQDSDDGHIVTLTSSSGSVQQITIPDNDTTYEEATTSASGLMSSSDKSKLNNVAAGANAANISYDSTNKKITKTINGTTSDVVSAANLKSDMNLSKSDVGLSNVENKSSATIRGELTSTNVTTALGYTPINASLKGANNGIAELDASGKVPSTQLPSYVDDVLEYSTISDFPFTGESGKIYIDISTNKTYRWSGTTYTEISPSLALGETSNTAFRGDYGKIAYDHASAVGAAYSNGLYKITTNAQGHVTLADAVKKSDITALGIPAQDTTYESKSASSGGTAVSLVTTGEKYNWNNKASTNTATTSANGLMSSSDKEKLDGVAAGATANTGTVTSVSAGAGLAGGTITTSGTVKANLTSETKLSNEAADGTETTGRVYPVRLDKNGKLAVNVPWTDNNTTYTFDGTYDASTNKAATVSTVTNAINALDGNLNSTTPGAGKTLTSFSETNGVVNATFGNISITKSQVSDLGTIGTAAAKGVDTSIAAASTSTNLPTSKAVAAFVEGKGYKTTDNNTTYSLTQDETDGHKIILTPSSGTAQTITIPDNNTWRPVSDSVSSTSSSDAASSKAVKTAYDLAASKTANTGTVTKVSTGIGLTGGDVTTTGTVKAKLKSETAHTADSATPTNTANRQYAVGVDKSGYLSVNVPWTDTNTDTKVTSAANHYAPSTASGSDVTASASGATAAWSIDVVKGVTLNTDGKGHVTGMSVTSGKIPANPNTDTKNTAGSTDTSSKIFLIGATSQAANPQTYSHDTAYVGTDGCLYSGGTKVLTSHQDISGKMNANLKGAANGVAELDENGKVPSSQLPSYVDDVLEYDKQSSFPTTGETGKIYIAQDTNKTYRWSGTAYVEISASIALGETSSTAYRGDRGKTAYDHASAKGNAFSEGLYKITTNAQGHVTAATAVVKADITALGIPGSDTNTHRPIQVNGTQILGDNTTALNLKAGSNVSVTNSSGTVTIAATDTTYSDATTSASGLMSSSDKTKLNGIATGAEVNQNAFSNVVVGNTTVSADSKTDTLTLAAGSNITITPDATNDKITIAATDTNTHRPIQVNGTEILGNNTTALNLKAGSNVSVTNSSGTVTIAATDTTYSSKSAASGGTDVSLVTTGEKYTWNNKSNLAIGTSSTTAAAGNHTHGLSIATSSGTNAITLAASTKYQLTAGGSTYIFTTPPNTTYSAITNDQIDALFT